MSKFTSAVLLSATALVASVHAITVNTPSGLVQCQPAQLSWAQGTAPYYVAIIPGGQPTAVALENFDTQTGSTYTWMVDIAAGTSVTVRVTDGTGAVNYSDNVTIQQGTETTCSSGASAGAAAAPVADSSSASAASSASSAPASSSSAASRLTKTSVSSVSGTITGSSTPKSSSAADAIGANAAAATSANTTSSASTLKAGTALLAAAAVFALAV